MEANHFPIPTKYYPEQKEERRNGWVVSWFSLQFYFGVSVSGEEHAKQHLQITLYKDGAPVDSVKSYAAMRKFGIMLDGKVKWMTLNNKKIYITPIKRKYKKM